jgi:hypothetical protein
MARILLTWLLQVLSGMKTHLSLMEGKVLDVLDMVVVVVVGGHRLSGLAIRRGQAICELEVDILEALDIKMLQLAWLLLIRELVLEKFC